MLVKQGRRGHIQGVCEAGDVVDGNIALRPLNGPYKSSVKSGYIGEGFLAKPAIRAKAAKVGREDGSVSRAFARHGRDHAD